MPVQIIVLLVLLLASLRGEALEDIELPPGFSIAEYADVPNARSLALGDGGTLFVANRSGDSVYAVVTDKDGGTRTIVLMDDMKSPNGIAFYDGDLYVAEIDKVTRYVDIEENLDNVPDREVLDIDLPSKRQTPVSKQLHQMWPASSSTMDQIISSVSPSLVV